MISETVADENKWSISGDVAVTVTVSEDSSGNLRVDSVKYVNGNGDSENTIINTGLREISVRKVWSDSNNKDKIRPTSIQVQLYADKVATGDPVTLDSSNSWKYTWTQLPITKDDVKITYTVEEVKVPDYYTAKITGSADSEFIITNAHTPVTTKVTVKKLWDDNNDQDGKRPDTLTVELLADGKHFSPVKSVTLTKSDDWAEKSIAGLDKYKYTEKKGGGYTRTAIKYTWVELDLPDGYTPKMVTDTTGYITTITNSYTPGSGTTRKIRTASVKTWSPRSSSGRRLRTVSL